MLTSLYFPAGSDTVSTCASIFYGTVLYYSLKTVSALSTFILAMIKYPQVQAKARDELNTVLGKYQMPTFDDHDSLPYLSAIVKETLRWQNIAPIAIPHMLIKDDEYRGYSFPAGAVVVPNTW